jgi:hypothetical protein
VRDNQRRTVLEQGINGGLDFIFGFGVERRGCFIQNKYRGIFIQGASNCDALLLPPRKSITIFTNILVDAIGVVFDDLR